MSLLDDAYAQIVRNKRAKSDAEDSRKYSSMLGYLNQNMNGHTSGLTGEESFATVADTNSSNSDPGQIVTTVPNSNPAITGGWASLLSTVLNTLANFVPGINAVNAKSGGLIGKGGVAVANAILSPDTKMTMGDLLATIKASPGAEDSFTALSEALGGESAEAQLAAMGLDANTIATLSDMGLSTQSIMSMALGTSDSFSPESGYYGMGGYGIFGDYSPTSEILSGLDTFTLANILADSGAVLNTPPTSEGTFSYGLGPEGQNEGFSFSGNFTGGDFTPGPSDVGPTGAP